MKSVYSKCPYCGHQNTHTFPDDSDREKVVYCEEESEGGCEKKYLVSWWEVRRSQSFKIEGPVRQVEVGSDFGGDS